jgi:hypothetical protein
MKGRKIRLKSTTARSRAAGDSCHAGSTREGTPPNPGTHLGMCGGGGFFGAILDADMLMTQSAISLVPFPPRTLFGVGIGMAVHGKVPNRHKKSYTYHMIGCLLSRVHSPWHEKNIGLWCLIGCIYGWTRSRSCRKGARARPTPYARSARIHACKQPIITQIQYPLKNLIHISTSTHHGYKITAYSYAPYV